MRTVILIIFLVFSIILPTYADTSSGLLAWWKFDEGSGASANDSSGNGRTGTLINTPTWINGVYGTGLRFDGATNEYVDAGATIPLDSNNWTIALWSYPVSFAGNQRLIGYYGDGPTMWTGGGSGLLLVHSGTVDFDCSMTNVLNTWQHIAITRSGSTVTCYRNGTQTATTSVFGSTFTADNFVYIGKSATYSGEYFNGALDDVRIYNRGLTAAEIKAIYLGEPLKIGNSAYIANLTYQ